MPARPALKPYVYFEADPADLPIRQPSEKGVGPEYVVKVQVKQKSATGMSLHGTTTTGRPLDIGIQVKAPGVIRVYTEEGDAERTKLALPAPSAGNVSIDEADERVWLRAEGIQAEIELEPFRITFLDPQGQKLLQQNPFDTDVTDRLITLPLGFSEAQGKRVAYHDSFTAEPDEHFYGFGEKFTDFDKRGQHITMWHYDAYGAHSERSYKNVPFFVSSRGYGVFVDSVTAIEFDMAQSNHSVFSIVVPDSGIDYYVIAGKAPAEIVSRYADLVSHPILPPKWAFGLWMSSGFEGDSAEAVLSRVKGLREHAIPTDVLHLDCYWQKHGRWSDNQWDLEMFPDPAGLLRQVHDAGYHICMWINSYIGIQSPLFDVAKDHGYLLKRTNGETWVGDLWGGDGHFHPPVGIVDVTNPDAVSWFQELLRPSLEIGCDVFKTDFGEGIPRDTVAYNGMTGDKLHNLYPLLYNDLVADITREVNGGPGMVWGRCTYAGGQRHAAQWGGDPNCTYQALASTLRAGLSMGLVGHAFWSHDIGGFHRTPTPDLFVRWAQLGLFSPLSRAHGMSSRLPWDYGEDAERIFREYVRLRYRLLPYIYSSAYQSHALGIPLMRAMAFSFPTDPCASTLDLQYMFGDDLLVAPIYNVEGHRSAYFPAGRWVDFWTREVIAGPQSRVIDAPLDLLPLYVRENALIPTTEPREHTTDGPFETLTVDAYLFDHGRCALYDADGGTTLEASLVLDRLDIHLEGARSELVLHLVPLPGNGAVRRVTVNGAAISDWSRGADGALMVQVRQSTSKE